MASLVISFDASSPVPVNGYVVKYRKIGSSVYTFVSPNPKSSPITINNIDDTFGYEGSIQSDCSNGVLSPSLTFNIYPCTGSFVKRINGICEEGIRYNESSIDNGDGTYTCSYHYNYTDGSSDFFGTETNTTPCQPGGFF